MNRGLATSVARLTVAGAVVLVGCQSRPNVAITNATVESPAAASPAVVPESAAVAPAAPLTNGQIAQIAVSANSGDSARGVMAEQKGTNAQVKSFGRLMVTQHSALNKKAAALVKQQNLPLQPSAADSSLVNSVRSMTQLLQGKTGMDFDTTYIDQEVQIHQTVLNDVDNKLIPGATNAQLKSFLQEERTVVEYHLKRARQIQTTLK